jgi:heme oxygenase
MSQVAERPANSLTQYLRVRTAALHRQAERSGVVAQLLGGSVSRSRYVLYLRNLLPAYDTLEQSLYRRKDDPAIGPIADRAVFRAEAIRTDLMHLAGPGWERTLPLGGAALRYAGRIAEVADGARLIAHAYIRYLGDLNGGRFLHPVLVGRFGQSAFTAFPDIRDPAGFILQYRAALDAACTPEQQECLGNEAVLAFEVNIAISEEMAAISAEPPAQA